MRPIRSLLVYFVLVFVGGALLAPWLYWLTHALAGHWPSFEKLASNPFHRFVGRALLGVALLGLWPLLRSCRMSHWRDLGLNARGRSVAGMASGFLLGFGSLACVALLAVSLGGRTFNPIPSSSQVMGRILSAALAAIFVSILEELLFRGTLFGILRKALTGCSKTTHSRRRRREESQISSEIRPESETPYVVSYVLNGLRTWQTALVLSSAVYALAHFIQKAGSPVSVNWLSGLALLPKMFQGGPPFIPAFLTLFVAGAILALAYQRTGALFFSMGLHAGWIFWLKTYGFLTVSAPGANPLIWGSGTLIDGWLALPVLGCVLCIVSKMKTAGERPGEETA